MARILYFSRDHTVHDQRFLAALAQTDHQVAFLRLEYRGNGAGEDLPEGISALTWRLGTTERLGTTVAGGELPATDWATIPADCSTEKSHR